MTKSLKKMILPLLTLSLLTVSCGTKPNHSDDPWVEESYVTLSTTEKTSGNLGGYMIEISTDAFLEAGSEYPCTFSTNLSDTTIDVKSSRPESATIEMTGRNSFKVITHKAGDSILTIYDSDGLVAFNKVMHVRTPYSAENIMKAVARYDIYTSTGIYGNYRFVVTDVYKTYSTGVVSGGEHGGKTGKSVFDLEYVGVEEGGAFDGHFYLFSCNVDKTQSDLSDDIKEVYVSKCADRIYIYYAEKGVSDNYYLLELFQPAELKEAM